MEDFTSFSFGGVESSRLGIYRTSDGDRFNEDLSPDIKDMTAEVPGRDGEYYFGSNYGTKKIEVNFAFNSLTEKQFRDLRATFNTKETKALIFNERPYKMYLAKIESPIELSYVCFDEPKKVLANFNGINGATTVLRSTGERERIYKGEGKISFVCYFPFAKSVYKVLPIGNEEWAESSGLLSNDEYEGIYDTYDTESEEIKIYNAGDLPTGFRLYLPASIVNQEITLEYRTESSDIQENPVASLKINPITLKEIDGVVVDEGVIVDTNNELIMGVRNFNVDQQGNYHYTTTGNIYNDCIDYGYFFRFNPDNKNSRTNLKVLGGAEGVQIFYDYLYF